MKTKKARAKPEKVTWSYRLICNAILAFISQNLFYQISLVFVLMVDERLPSSRLGQKLVLASLSAALLSAIIIILIARGTEWYKRTHVESKLAEWKVIIESIYDAAIGVAIVGIPFLAVLKDQAIILAGFILFFVAALYLGGYVRRFREAIYGTWFPSLTMQVIFQMIMFEYYPSIYNM